MDAVNEAGKGLSVCLCLRHDDEFRLAIGTNPHAGSRNHREIDMHIAVVVGHDEVYHCISSMRVVK